jgi:hypothetical protein
MKCSPKIKKKSRNLRAPKVEGVEGGSITYRIPEVVLSEENFLYNSGHTFM